MARIFMISAFLALSFSAGAEPEVTEPNAAFLESLVVLRPGVLDLGETTVAELVKRITSVKLTDGSNPQVIGWVEDDNEYTLRLQFTDKPVTMTFILQSDSEHSQSVSYLLPVDMAGQEVEPMAFLLMLF